MFCRCNRYVTDVFVLEYKLAKRTLIIPASGGDENVETRIEEEDNVGKTLQSKVSEKRKLDERDDKGKLVKEKSATVSKTVSRQKSTAAEDSRKAEVSSKGPRNQHETGKHSAHPFQV